MTFIVGVFTGLLIGVIAGSLLIIGIIFKNWKR